MKKIVHKIKKGISRIINLFQRDEELVNLHMAATSAQKYKLSSGLTVYKRPSFSDHARVHEFETSIYSVDADLFDKVKFLNPQLLVDIGANIGLSSLALATQFPSVVSVVGVEAERENYLVLEQNYKLWEETLPHLNGYSKSITFSPVYAIATSNNVNQTFSIGKLPGGLSASGTFTFSQTQDIHDQSSVPENSQVQFSNDTVSLNSIFDNHLDSGHYAVVKVDIEGGESELFSDTASWLSKTVFMTAEIHDCMGVPNSSRNLLNKLAQYDFAIIPREDVLHCFNRKLLGIN